MKIEPSEVCHYRLHGGLWQHWQIQALNCGNSRWSPLSAHGWPTDGFRQPSGGVVEVNRKTPSLWGTLAVITGPARIVAIDSGHGR
jgi:hypothetical protein